MFCANLSLLLMMLWSRNTWGHSVGPEASPHRHFPFSEPVLWFDQPLGSYNGQDAPQQQPSGNFEKQSLLFTSLRGYTTCLGPLSEVMGRERVR